MSEPPPSTASHEQSELQLLQTMAERLIRDVAERDVEIEMLTAEAEAATTMQALVARPDEQPRAAGGRSARLYDSLAVRALVALVAFVAILLCP